MKALLIDNFDSFIYNLGYELELLGLEVIVVRNNADYDHISDTAKKVDCIVLSPGPGKPSEAGCCFQLLEEFKSLKPILGVCLGHQAIIEAFGGTVEKAHHVVHGKAKKLLIKEITGLFTGIERNMVAARYHSLVATSVPDSFVVTAVSEQGEVMAIQHKELPIFGLQFHPESIMSMSGNKLLNSFKDLVSSFSAKTLKGADHDAVA